MQQPGKCLPCRGFGICNCRDETRSLLLAASCLSIISVQLYLQSNAASGPVSPTKALYPYFAARLLRQHASFKPKVCAAPSSRPLGTWPRSRSIGGERLRKGNCSSQAEVHNVLVGVTPTLLTTVPSSMTSSSESSSSQNNLPESGTSTIREWNVPGALDFGGQMQQLDMLRAPLINSMTVV